MIFIPEVSKNTDMTENLYIENKTQKLIHFNNCPGVSVLKRARKGLNSNQIKLIAIAAMTIDHLTWAAVLIAVCRKDDVKQWVKIVLIVAACLITSPSDWSTIAMICPFFLYMHRGRFRLQAWDIIIWTAVYAAVYFLFLDRLYGVLQLFTFLTIPILANYNGERGTWRGMKWFFYIYYPAHLVVIGIIRLALHGNVSIIF